MSKNPIGISELITRIGDDNVSFQSLDSCMISTNYSSRKGTVITFGTDQPVRPSGTRDLGLVVWLPRERVNEILESKQEGRNPND